MNRLEEILVATDFSQSSGHAVQTAQALAKAFGSEIILIHVIPKVPDSPVNLRTVRMGIRERLDDLSKAPTKAGIRAVETDYRAFCWAVWPGKSSGQCPVR